MKPGSPQAKALFLKKETDFKREVEQTKGNIKKLEESIAKNTDGFADYRQIALAAEYLTLVNLYIAITDDMLSLRGVRNESYLSEGRKAYYSALMCLEKVGSDIINLEPTEIQAKVDKIPKFDPARKIIFFRKMGFTLDRLSESFGEKSKYRWGFVDMFGRYAVIVKNFMDYKQIATRDPRKAFFEEHEVILNMLLDLLSRAADKLREKYEMATKEFEDMNKAIRILDELRRINVILGDSAGAEDNKRKMDVWKDKLEKDLKSKEETKKKR